MSGNEKRKKKSTGERRYTYTAAACEPDPVSGNAYDHGAQPALELGGDGTGAGERYSYSDRDKDYYLVRGR